MTTEKIIPAKKKAVEPEEYYFEYGSVTGMLEEINVHNGKNIFQLYVFTGQKVKCKFPLTLLEQVRLGLGKYVEVYGKLTSVESSPFPIRIEVTDIEIFPPQEELPTLASLRGIAEGMLGDKTSEEYVREIRNEWQ